MIRTLVITTVLVSLTGCNWIGRQADALGSHMPVIGERCEHWQCITSSGRQRSDMYKMQAQSAQQESDEEAQAQQYMTPEQQQYQQQYQQYQAQQQQYQQQYQGQQAPAQAAQPSGYRPSPEMNPYDYYNQ